MSEKTFTFDVEKISNGYIIYHDGKKVYREGSSDVNITLEDMLRVGMHDHVIEQFPKTVQRLEVVVSVAEKVME